jgi:protocatechuate 3,4-dioxygenase beta subunit
MDIRYRHEYESALCEHSEHEIFRPDGTLYIEVDRLTTDGVTFDVIRPSDRTEAPHASLSISGPAIIEIADPCGDDESCIEIIVRNENIETRIYLPEEITLTSLDGAICSAIMAKRARDEGR